MRNILAAVRHDYFIRSSHCRDRPTVIDARIYGGPVAAARRKREALQIPEGFTPVIMLRVGKYEKGNDAVSGASPRKTKEEIGNWVR